jgi:FkbM family methyltransferase
VTITNGASQSQDGVVMSAISWLRRRLPSTIKMQKILDAIVNNAGEDGALSCSVNDFQLNVPAGMLLMHRHCSQPTSENPLRYYVEPKHLKWMCDRLLKGNVAVDVGASGGLLTAALSKTVGPAGRVYAFEPADRAHRLLKKTVLFNELDNTIIEKMAVSNALGTVRFSEYPFSAGDDLAWRPEVSAINTAKIIADMVETYEVPVTTLDEYFLPKPFTIQAIKIDVEGFETHVLQGGSRIIERDHPMFSIDIHRRVDDAEGDTEELVRAALAPHGYRFEKFHHVLTASTTARIEPVK